MADLQRTHRPSAEQGMTALALTDHGSMYGTIEFAASATQAGIKLIFGLEAYVSPRGMTQKQGKTDAATTTSSSGKDDVGYRNLLALTTAAHIEGLHERVVRLSAQAAPVARVQRGPGTDGSAGAESGDGPIDSRHMPRHRGVHGPTGLITIGRAARPL